MSIHTYEIPKNEQEFLRMLDDSSQKIEEISQLIVFSTKDLSSNLKELCDI